MPLMPGISTSRVITSGWSWATLDMASRALKPVPTTSIWGSLVRPWVINVRAMMESSTTMTRIFLLADHIAMVVLPSQDSPIQGRHRFWNVEGATVW